ncbi:hypothetical protein [uncultured Shewanella sp.]|uniref:hypothetical protein n=1 Tax=uncultured Shewanella sp. TaxID=173975 RepID=UPI002631DF40|nr:hypothetical protein [uncultured Shewanella sp.]
MKMAVIGCINNGIFEEIRVPLDEDIFDEVTCARKTLVDMLDMEITYDQIMEEFTSFKGKMKESNIRILRSGGHRGYEEMHELRSNLNRIAFNLFNLSKFYLDKHCYENQTKSFVLNLTEDKQRHAEVVRQRKVAYENNLYYTFGGVLRNVVQHHLLPVENFRSGISRANLKDKAVSSFSIPIDMNKVAPLVQLKSDKRALDKVLKHEDFKPDLHKILDGYVYALGTFHTLNRTLVTEAVGKAKEVLKDFESKVIVSEGLVEATVRIIDVLENHREVSLFHLDLSWYKVADYLQCKNGRAVDYGLWEFNGYL